MTFTLKDVKEVPDAIFAGLFSIYFFLQKLQFNITTLTIFINSTNYTNTNSDVLLFNS